MRFSSSLFVLCAVSLFTGTGLVFTGLKLNPDRKQSAYAVVIVSEEIPDREIRSRLGDSLISESSQWVFLDDFSGLARIPLDEYGDRILPLDPRNDGYADKLHSFLVRNGKRFSFFPLNSGLNRGFEKRLPALLAGIPFSLEYIGFEEPLGIFFIIFGIAAGALFFFRYLPFRPRIETMDLILCLPVLIIFAFYGTVGFAFSALLLGLAALLRQPIEELFMIFRYRGEGRFLNKKSEKNRFRRDIYEPFKLNWFLTPVFLAAGTLVVLAAKIPPILFIGVFLIFALLFGLSVRAFSLKGDSQGHIRFFPVSIVKSSLNPVFLAAMLPFVLAACAAGLSTSALRTAPDTAALTSLKGELISEDEYLAHAAFQSSFSFRPLGRDSSEGYLSYSLATDGLINPNSPFSSEKAFNAPPFPLKGLMDFLASLRGDKNR
jgi:hypothetical protein